MAGIPLLRSIQEDDVRSNCREDKGLGLQLLLIGSLLEWILGKKIGYLQQNVLLGVETSEAWI